jgi:hypothetical protein
MLTMSSDLPGDPGDRLVDADAGISEAHLKEFRMGLELSVQSLERAAHDSQRNTIRFFFGLVTCYAIGFLMSAARIRPEGTGQALGALWVVVTWIALLGFVLSLVRYWTKHRPTLERARTDLQIAMFGELQREIAELRGELKRGGPQQ